MPSSTAIFAETCVWEMPCDLHAVAELRRQARAFFAQARLIPAEVDAWEWALAESANNAVNYAIPDRRQLPIRVDLIVTHEWVEVRVTDHTAGFDLPETVELPPEDSERGRGLFIIKRLTDEARYLRGRGENCLVLRKRRAVSEPAPPLGRAANLAEELRETTRTLDLMTEELSSCYESLTAIFRFSAELQSDSNPASFLQRWMDQLLSITESNWCVLRLPHGDGRELRLAASSDRDWRGEPVRLEKGSSSGNSVEARAATQRADVWFDLDSPLSPGDPLASLAGAGCGFAHPLFVNDVVVGVLAAGRHSRVPFTAGQVSVIQTFGDFLGLQIHSRQMQEERIRTRVNTRDLEMAANDKTRDK